MGRIWSILGNGGKPGGSKHIACSTWLWKGRGLAEQLGGQRTPRVRCQTRKAMLSSEQRCCSVDQA